MTNKRKTDMRSMVEALDTRRQVPQYRFSNGRVFYQTDESNRAVTPSDSGDQYDNGRDKKAQ